MSSPASIEYDRILPGIMKTGIAGEWVIVIPEEPDIVENTAVGILVKFLGKARLSLPVVKESEAPGGHRILLGRKNNMNSIRTLDDEGSIQIGNIPEQDDGFHVKKVGDDIAVAGANPRGVLYAVYELEGFIRDGAKGPLDTRKIPRFRKRCSEPAYYFNPGVNLFTDEFTKDKAEYLSRLGINQFLIGEGHLHQLVKSEVFPFQTPPDSDLRRKVRAIASICGKYGIDCFKWIDEPILPSILAQHIRSFPAEALGRVRRPWGGGEDGLETTLCISSPIVQEHLRNIVHTFVREFSEVKGFVFYNLDGHSWLCTPSLCPRCAVAVKESPPDCHNPWETQALLASLLAESAHEERPDFQFLFWGSIHYHGEALRKLLDNARGYDALLSSWNGSDRDIMVPDVEEPSDSYRMTQAIAKERNVPVYTVHAFNRLECIQAGFPFPFHVCDALKKFGGWGAENLMELSGPDPAHNPVNGLVMKEFMCNPDQDPPAFLHSLAVGLFGKAAGERVFHAWEEIRAGMNIWNSYLLHPLSGSQLYLSIGTAGGVPQEFISDVSEAGGLPAPILPDIVKSYEYNLDIRVRVEPWRASDYQRFRGKPFVDDMEKMERNLSNAARYAAQAVDMADDRELIGIRYYIGSPEGLGHPTCKEYAELNHAAIAISAMLCGQRVNILRAVHMLRNMETRGAAGDKAGALEAEAQYHDLIKEDISLQERFIGLMSGFREKRPCLTLVGITQREIEAFISGTRQKIIQLTEFLKSGR